jgi:hypothetical protein
MKQLIFSTKITMSMKRIKIAKRSFDLAMRRSQGPQKEDFSGV